MGFAYDAACLCVMGNIRSNNEDNLYFDGLVLDEEHIGLTEVLYKRLNENVLAFAVFDGMGGASDGQLASYLAAASFKQDMIPVLESGMLSETVFSNVIAHMNTRVSSQAEAFHNNMGTTVAAIGFCDQDIYICNVGDSRIYRFRNEKLTQISMDHVGKLPPFLEGEKRRKPGITQYIGISQDELTLEPYIVTGEIKAGDRYLLCSDGLTDMVSNKELLAILLEKRDVSDTVRLLTERALLNGGRDNTTVLLIQIVEI